MDDPHDRSSPKRGNRFGKRRGVGVIIPVYRGCAETFACLASVLESIPDQASVVVVDDASPETQLVTGLDAFARDGRIRLICHRQNRGFPAAVNAGIRAASGQDIVLLNSDTLVANNWVERLQRAAFSAPDIGTVTPFTNDGSLVSYPSAWQANPAPDGRALRNLDQLAYRANGDTVFDLPTGVGFCMYIRRDCLDAVGLFREDVFAQGYGEENDFCLRAKNLGWRHVAAPGVFVSHLAARSFAGRTDGAAAHLRSRNLSRLNQLHFGYDALIAAFAQEDPLAKARHALDEQRFRKAQSDDTSNDTSSRSSALLITHSRGGGVQRRVRERCAEWQASGVRAVVLSPTSNGACTVSDFGEVYPNLIFSIPQQFGELLELLCATKPVCVELHHFLGHHPHLLKLADCLKIPLDIVVHDYAWFCPQITLTGTDHRYCGEPEINVCENCTSDLGGEISPGALRERSHQLFSAARRVVVPSRDTARRLERHFPAVMPEICPWESDTPAPPAPRPRTRPKLRICVAGALGAHKGYDTLLALGRDVAARRLPIEYVLVGYSHDDLPLLETRAISVTGRFQAGECAGLLARQQSDLGFLPSGIPETWSYTLSEMWEAGLLVAAFDIGAPAERIRTTGRGLLLPLGLPGERINEVFLHWWRSTTGR
jgi:GT2 family glycosyltransferase/glycosyltransferase involved in cell wall biosynthesis